MIDHTEEAIKARQKANQLAIQNVETFLDPESTSQWTGRLAFTYGKDLDYDRALDKILEDMRLVLDMAKEWYYG